MQREAARGVAEAGAFLLSLPPPFQEVSFSQFPFFPINFPNRSFLPSLLPRDGTRFASQIIKPTSTLFVVNFDELKTTSKDLERHFNPYGAITRLQIKKNFAFIQARMPFCCCSKGALLFPSHLLPGGGSSQSTSRRHAALTCPPFSLLFYQYSSYHHHHHHHQFETVEMATKALEGTHLSSFDGRVISVEASQMSCAEVPPPSLREAGLFGAPPRPLSSFSSSRLTPLLRSCALCFLLPLPVRRARGRQQGLRGRGRRRGRPGRGEGPQPKPAPAAPGGEWRGGQLAVLARCRAALRIGHSRSHAYDLYSRPVPLFFFFFLISSPSRLFPLPRARRMRPPAATRPSTCAFLVPPPLLLRSPPPFFCYPLDR